MTATSMRKRTLPLLAATMLSAAASLPAYAVDCAAPKGLEQTRGCAAASQGPVALRHYIERTRMIHNLYYWDYANYAGEARVSRGEGSIEVALLK